MCWFLVNRDLDQLRVVVAQPNLNVKIGGAYTGLLTGLTGKTHQEVADISVMRSMPNMVVLAPADGVEARLAMLAASRYEGPVYVRFTRDPHPLIFDADYRFEIGKAVLARQGVEFESGMPGFAEQLSDPEIWDIIAYIKSTWPERQRAIQAERSGQSQ